LNATIQRAAQSDKVKEAIEKDEMELIATTVELKKLEKTNRKLVEMIQSRDDMQKLNKAMSDTLQYTSNTAMSSEIEEEDEMLQTTMNPKSIKPIHNQIDNQHI
jgi:hypothetical protein